MLGLIEVSDAHRAAITMGIDTHSRLLGLKVPDGWPMYPDVFNHPGDPDWPMFLFVDTDRSSILGSGGFLAGPDSNGLVQVGYEVAPACRGHGIATRAMLEIISRKPKARFAAAVAPVNQPSIAVLRKLGFRETDRVIRHGAEVLSLWLNA